MRFDPASSDVINKHCHAPEGPDGLLQLIRHKKMDDENFNIDNSNSHL